MGHIKLSKTRAERTASEWLPVGAQIGNLVNTWAGRSDIVAYVGPGAGGHTPACFNPPVAEVEVNVNVAFGEGINPEIIGDLSKRDTLFDWPKASGAIFHEALHARYSRYDLIKVRELLNDNEFNAFMSLEESRIEKHGVENYPGNRVFLRACALEIVVHDLLDHVDDAKSNGVRSIASLAALTLARIDAGSLYDEDITEVRNIIVDFLGQDIVDQLRGVWLKFQAHDNHHNPMQLIDLAKEWEKILSNLSEERGEKTEMPDNLKKLMSAVIKDIVEAIEEAQSHVEISTNDEVQDQQTQEDWQKQVQSVNKKAKEKLENKKISEEIFSRSSEDIQNVRTSSKLVDIRVPNAEERAAAVKIASLLEKAKYRERDETDITSILPPGRLRTRAVVQNAAYKAQGSLTKAEPWRRTKRRHTDDPTLRVGVMVDISGSMGSAMQPMATTAWVMSEASRRVQGKCAMVYYGQDVFPTLKPGQHLDKVNVYSATDGTEKFNKAFKAIDGSLDLLYGTGARLLVVVSDGNYTDEEKQKARETVQLCDANGVAVLWLSFDDYESRYSYPSTYVEGTSARHISNIKTPTDVAVEIGKTAAEILEKIGARSVA